MASRVNLLDSLPGRAQDANGDPVSGALMFVYAAGTLTAVSRTSDVNGAAEHATPIVADASGAFPEVYVEPALIKVDVQTPAGASLPGYPIDNIDMFRGQATIEQVEGYRDQIYDADALRILDAFTTAPSDERARLIDTTVRRLKLAGLWTEIDVFYDAAAHDAQASTINWKAPTGDPALLVNSPTFTAGVGTAGNGTDAYIDSQVTFEDMVQYGQNSAHVGVWGVDNVAADSREIGATGNANMFIQTRTAGNAIAIRVNDTTALSQAETDSRGHTLANRSGASARQTYKNGVQVDSDTTASTGIPSGTLSLFRSSSTYSAKQIALWHAGGSLTASQVSSLYDILNDYLAGVILSATAQLNDFQKRVSVASASSSSGTLALDLSTNSVFTVTLSENITTITLSNWGGSVFRPIYVHFTQDATGGRTVTFPAGVKWAGGVVPTITTDATKRDIIMFSSLDGGVNVDAAVVGQNFDA